MDASSRIVDLSRDDVADLDLYRIVNVYTLDIALYVRNPEADHLARELAAITGESLTDAIIVALAERLERERGRSQPGLGERLRRLAADASLLPVLDDRPAEEILGYDVDGLPR